MTKLSEIKERTITVKLQDSDCEKLIRLCGQNGMTIGELIECFICDLIGGTEAGGRDEVQLAEFWYSRRGFDQYPQKTLLRHLLMYGYEPNDYIDCLQNIALAEEDKEFAMNDPKNCDAEEISCIEDNIKIWKEELADMRAEWNPDQKPDMERELTILQSWLNERNRLLME